MMTRTKAAAKNVFIVNSPFQVLCAIEAREVFCKGALNILVVLLMDAEGTLGDTQLRSLTADGWGDVLYVPYGSKKGLRRELAKPAIVAQILARHGRVQRVFVGNGRLTWLLAAGRLIGDTTLQLDDGAASIRILSSRAAEPPAAAPGTQFFSIFALPEHAPWAQRNTLSTLREARRSRPFTQGSHALLVGQKLSEDGQITLSEELFLWKTYMDQSKASLFRYIPHRGDSTQKLTALQSMGVEIVNPPVPFELFLVRVTEIPAAIASFYSTTLFTSAMLLPGVATHAIQFAQRNTAPARAEEIRSVYARLRQNGTEVLDYPLPDHEGG